MRGAYAHISENPQIVMYYRNPARAAQMPYRSSAIRFHGRARMVNSGPERERVWGLTVPAEQERDPTKQGVGVLIALDRVEELSGVVIMQRK